MSDPSRKGEGDKKPQSVIERKTITVYNGPTWKQRIWRNENGQLVYEKDIDSGTAVSEGPSEPKPAVKPETPPSETPMSEQPEKKP